MKDKSGWREWSRKILLAAAAAALILSVCHPYWHIKIKAPQYPQGLSLTVHLNRVEGDVREIDMLNHYIGMRPLQNAAKLERALAIPGIILTILSLLIDLRKKQRWQFLFMLPALLLPVFFAADLFLWMRDYGLHLDPRAPLSSAVKPFIPPLIGEGKIAQFNAHASFMTGFYLSLAAAGLSTFALLLAGTSRKRNPRGLAAVAALVLFLSLPAQVQAKTLTVDKAGRYPTVASALNEAGGGDTVLVKPGTYAGSVEISKTVSIKGEGWPVLDGGGKGTVVKITAPDVKIEGLVIRGSGISLSSEDAGLLILAPRAVIEKNRFEDVLFGVYARQAPDSVIRGNRFWGKSVDLPRRGDLIRVWYSDRVRIENNETFGGRDAVLWYSKDLIVKGNIFRDGRYGLHFMYCHGADVEENVLEENSVGAFLMYSHRLRLFKNRILRNRGPSGYGIGFKDMYETIIESNVIADNRTGIFLDNSTGAFHNNLIGYNDAGVTLQPSSGLNQFSENSFVDNGEQVVIESQARVTSNEWTGNFWSDYRGYDADRDGTGDQPYHAVRFFERLTDRYPSFKIFNGNLSAQALDLASRVFPLFAPQPAFTDSSPAMAPVQIMAPGKQPISWPWIFFSGTLLLPSLGVWQRHSKATWPKATTSPSTAFNLSQPPGSNPEAVVHVRGLEKTFGNVRALKSLDFTVRKGETVVLWGPNGAGKTTALRCLLGIMPFKGDLKVMGLDVTTQGKEVRRRVGYVPQEIRMHTDQTVQETVCFYAALRRVSLQEASGLIARWGLTEAKNKRVNALSGGMKQKLALVIALLSDPPILFLDESTNHLDLNARREFISLLSSLKSAGKTIVLCSHRHSEVWKLADRVVVLKAGEKIAEGTPEEVRSHLGGRAVLALTVKGEHAPGAALLLRLSGIRAEQNGSQILIEVPLDKKTLPFALLHEASIPVLDYEMESDTAFPEAL